MPGAVPEPQYHNYLMEGVSNTLHWVQGLLQPGSGMPAAVPGAAGTEAQQLSAAAAQLKQLSQQMGEVGPGKHAAAPRPHTCIRLLAK